MCRKRLWTLSWKLQTLRSFANAAVAAAADHRRNIEKRTVAHLFYFPTNFRKERFESL